MAVFGNQPPLNNMALKEAEVLQISADLKKELQIPDEKSQSGPQTKDLIFKYFSKSTPINLKPPIRTVAVGLANSAVSLIKDVLNPQPVLQSREVLLKVPPNWTPNQKLYFLLPNGDHYDTIPPPDVRPGDEFVAEVPPLEAMVSVVVPEDWKSPDTLLVQDHRTGGMLQVTPPLWSVPGSVLVVKLPPIQTTGGLHGLAGFDPPTMDAKPLSVYDPIAAQWHAIQTGDQDPAAFSLQQMINSANQGHVGFTPNMSNIPTPANNQNFSNMNQFRTPSFVNPRPSQMQNAPKGNTPFMNGHSNMNTNSVNHSSFNSFTPSQYNTGNPNMMAPNMMAQNMMAQNMMAPNMMAQNMMAPNMMAQNMMTPNVNNSIINNSSQDNVTNDQRLQSNSSHNDVIDDFQEP